MTVWRASDAPGEEVTVEVNQMPTVAYAGETVATLLLREGYRAFGRHPVTGEALAPACMMGVCFGCLCTIDGRPGSQACLEPVREGLTVETDSGVGS